jgi:hypothetical protein
LGEWRAAAAAARFESTIIRRRGRYYLVAVVQWRVPREDIYRYDGYPFHG